MLGAAGVWGVWHLGLHWRQLVPGPGGLAVAGEFFGAALRPAWTYEAAAVPPGTQPLLMKVLEAAAATLTFAGAGMSLALLLGTVLGVLASSAWWTLDVDGAGKRPSGVRLAVFGAARVAATFLRSIHELLWAAVFLASFGLHDTTAVLALAIPYGGTLAKVFSEILDEAPRDSATVLLAGGATPRQAFLFGLLPRAWPDLLAYAFYRFECAVRATAVLGFFGFPTLGYYLSVSFENLHYREVWTYLYALVALVVILDAWSGAYRRR
ncbi:MAG: ABC transporter permease subunit, partial [Acidobacteriota bacterium]